MTTTEITKRLDYLPLVAQALSRLEVAKVVDALIPPHPRNHVTTGQCVEALVVAILCGTRPLYRVAEVLAGLDLETAFGWTADASCFNDERLGNAFDAIFKAGHSEVASEIFFKALEEFALDLTTIHGDTTSVSVHGAYSGSVAPEDGEDPDAVPHVTKGRSKDRRGLKQVIYGTAVTSDGVPIFGRASSGNRADALESRFLLRRLADLLPEPTKTTFVCDSKFFSGETLLLARDFGISCVTLMPRGVGLWQTAFKRFLAAKADGTLETFKHDVSDRLPHDPRTWTGAGFDLDYEYKDDDKVVHQIPLRAVVVESTSLATDKRRSLAKERAREAKDLEKLGKRVTRRLYECDRDGQLAVEKLAKRTHRFHRLVAELAQETRSTKRAGPGRPRKGVAAPTETVWRIVFRVERDEAAFSRILAEESCYVLVSGRAEKGKSRRTDREIFDTYADRACVEITMHWLKGLREIAPIFLKSNERIAVLGQIYVVALMVHALIQREARARLLEKQARVPGNVRPTDRPTTEVLFRLFEKISTTRVGDTDRDRVVVTGLTTVQARALALLGIDLTARRGVRLAEARSPGPTDRGYVPPAGAARHRSHKVPTLTTR